MKIHSNIEEYSKQFQKYKSEVQRKLKGMVELFSINITLAAINNTPYGTMNNWYNSDVRAEYQLEPFPGHARGGWIVGLNSFDTSSLGDRAESPGDSTAGELAESHLQSYVLGQDIYIGNNIPYVNAKGFPNEWNGSLEGGYSSQAPSGIITPTLDLVFNVFQINLKEYYDES